MGQEVREWCLSITRRQDKKDVLIIHHLQCSGAFLAKLSSCSTQFLTTWDILYKSVHPLSITNYFNCFLFVHTFNLAHQKIYLSDTF